MLARLRSRAQEEKGFTLIELLVVVLIIGILAAIAIPAFLGQKKGAQDSNAKSLLRNAAIALESYYSENQTFDGATGGTTGTLAAIEPNITWQAGAAAAKDDQVQFATRASVTGNPTDQYRLTTVSASTVTFDYFRNENAQTFKCKTEAGAAATPAWNAATTPDSVSNCGNNREW